MKDPGRAAECTKGKEPGEDLISELARTRGHDKSAVSQEWEEIVATTDASSQLFYLQVVDFWLLLTATAAVHTALRIARVSFVFGWEGTSPRWEMLSPRWTERVLATTLDVAKKHFWETHIIIDSLDSDIDHAVEVGTKGGLQAKSRHRNRSVLGTYTTLGDAAVSELTSWFDSPQEGRQR